MTKRQCLILAIFNILMWIVIGYVEREHAVVITIASVTIIFILLMLAHEFKKKPKLRGATRL